MSNEPLDIIKEVEAIESMYNETATSKYFRALIFGDVGTGKTKIFNTCPRPIHIDSFDPGGTQTVKKGIDERWIIADSSFENEDPNNPTQLLRFEKELDKRIASGYFNYFGTYGLDSLTTFSDAGMNFILKKFNRRDMIPKMIKGGDNDYVSQQKAMEPLLRKILNLPCHVILTAHPDFREDQELHTKIIGPKVSGQLATKLPMLFSEIYYADTQPSKEPTNVNGRDYVFLTRANGYYRCRSRFASLGKIEMYEKQDMKSILRKAGFSDADKSIPWLETKQEVL